MVDPVFDKIWRLYAFAFLKLQLADLKCTHSERLVYQVTTDNPMQVSSFNTVVDAVRGVLVGEDQAVVVDGMEFNFDDGPDVDACATKLAVEATPRVDNSKLYFEICHLNPSRLPVQHGAPSITGNSIAVTLLDQLECIMEPIVARFLSTDTTPRTVQGAKTISYRVVYTLCSRCPSSARFVATFRCALLVSLFQHCSRLACAD